MDNKAIILSILWLFSMCIECVMDILKFKKNREDVSLIHLILCILAICATIVFVFFHNTVGIAFLLFGIYYLYKAMFTDFADCSFSSQRFRIYGMIFILFLVGIFLICKFLLE